MPPDSLKPDTFSNPQAFLDYSLHLLGSASQDKTRREARFVSLATVDHDEQSSAALPAVRTVVLRHWALLPPVWRFHTDRRADKVGELTASPRVSALFWDATNRLQIRLDGNVSECVDLDAVAESWQSLGKRAQQSFWRQEAPGTSLASPGRLSFPKMNDGDAESQPSPNFMLLDVAVSSVDCLSLRHDPHHRVYGLWQDGWWVAQWIAP